MTLGIDIGGTTINLGLVNDTRIVKKTRVPSFPSNASKEETLDYLCARIQDILVPGVQKIGIGVPSVTDPVKGIVYNAANIPSWDEVHLKELVEKRFGIPVFVNNDANCYAMGAWAQCGKPDGVVACVTLGTGTGVGIVIDGRLFAGSHCGAGELGAIPYNGFDYETFCSKKFFTSRGWGGKEAADEAEAGNPEALDLFHEFGSHLGEFLTVVMYAYDANRIVIGGGIAHSFPLLEEAIWETLRLKYPYGNALEGLVIEPMPNEDTALVGATFLE